MCFAIVYSTSADPEWCDLLLVDAWVVWGPVYRGESSGQRQRAGSM